MALPRRIRNRLLAALSPTDFTELSNELQPANLAKRQVLYEVGEAFDFIYFIEEGFASVLTTMENGTSSEVGMIGSEGMIGASALLGGRVSAQQVIMQLPGAALRISAAACKLAFDENRGVRAVVLRFIEHVLNFSSQTAGCNRLHSVEQRSARWAIDGKRSAVLGCFAPHARGHCRNARRAPLRGQRGSRGDAALGPHSLSPRRDHDYRPRRPPKDRLRVLQA